MTKWFKRGLWIALCIGLLAACNQQESNDNLTQNNSIQENEAARVKTYSSTPNAPIPDSQGRNVAGRALTDTIRISDSGTVQDLKVVLDINHTWVGDLKIFLIHKTSGTRVRLVNRPGRGNCSGNDIKLTLDDKATPNIDTDCSRTNPAYSQSHYQPSRPLSRIVGKSLKGNWTLRINDYWQQDTGRLNSWQLKIETGNSPPPPPPPNPTGTVKFYITQSAAKLDGSTPLAAGRNGFFRAFVTASAAGASQNSEVRLFAQSNGQTLGNIKLSGPTNYPTSINEGNLSSSYNAQISGDWIKQGLEVYLTIKTQSGNTVRIPASGTKRIEVRPAPVFDIRLVPINYSGRTPNVAANKDAYLKQTRAMMPLNRVNISVRANPYSFNGDLNTGNGWGNLLSQMNNLRITEGAPSRRYYHGIVDPRYRSGIAGIGYLPGKAAVSWSHLPSGSGVVAHELGHNWGRRHIACGGPAGTDPNYPYNPNTIGIWGYDLSSNTLKSPANYKDLMTYCDPAWISDYTFEEVLKYRQAESFVATAMLSQNSQEQALLLISGSIQGNKVTLDPAFEITALPNPPEPGPYVLEGLDSNQDILFQTPFAVTEVPDLDEPLQHFNFTLLLNQADADKISTLRVVRGKDDNNLRSIDESELSTQALGEAGEVLAERHSTAVSVQQVATEPVAQVLEDGRISISWDAAAYPSVIIRDAASGEVLSIATGGEAILAAFEGELELILSNGIQSQSVKLQVK